MAISRRCAGRVSKVLCAIAGVTSLACLTACVDAEQSAQAAAGTTTVSYGAASPTAASSPHNQSDVRFLEQAVSLREQATALAKAATTRTSRDSVRALARQLATAEAPSVTDAQDLLRRWRQPAPPATPSPDPVPESRMRQLAAATGGDFDRKWAAQVDQLLTADERVAGDELATGAYPPAKAMAVQWSTEVRDEQKKLAGLRSAL